MCCTNECRKILHAASLIWLANSVRYAANTVISLDLKHIVEKLRKYSSLDKRHLRPTSCRNHAAVDLLLTQTEEAARVASVPHHGGPENDGALGSKFAFRGRTSRKAKLRTDVKVATGMSRGPGEV